MAYDITNPDTDPSLLYNNYYPNLVQPVTTTITGDTSIVINTINGNSGKVTGPSITISGGTTGLTFAGSGSTITLTGTLIAANGGTGQSAYTKGDLLAASAATTLSKLAAAANNARLATDSTTLTGLIWILASTGWGAPSGTLSRAAYASYAGQTVSAAYVQAEAQQTDDAVKLLSQVVAAILTDLRTQKIFNN
jgi:hypothetical protein